MASSLASSTTPRVGDSQDDSAITSPAGTGVSGHKLTLSLEACLAPWLECFSGCSARWGRITDVRTDGSTYKRHGIVVGLTSRIKVSHEGITCHLWRLRHAIDLVKLALVVDPCVIKPLLARHLTTHDVDIDAFTRRDVPFDLHLRLEIKARVAQFLNPQLAMGLVKDLDTKKADHSDVLRRYLVDHALRSASSRRLSLLPVKTTFSVTPYVPGGLDRFFGSLALMAEELFEYQEKRSTKWTVSTRHAPLIVDGIHVRLGDLPLAANVVKQASIAVSKGIPMSTSDLKLDIKSFDCEETDLRSLLTCFTNDGDKLISVSRTGFSFQRPIDSADMSDKIRMLFRCIGGSTGHLRVDLTSLFALCRQRVNRRAVMRGLVESILSRKSSVSLAIDGSIRVDVRDAQDFERAVEHWRRQNPLHAFRLKSLRLELRDGSVEFIRALVTSLQDVESVSLRLSVEDMIDDEDFAHILRFPSLRSLSITNLAIETMDIFASSTPDTPELRLEGLQLNGLMLEDSSSMVSFLESLDPRSVRASGLAHTLKMLTILEDPNAQFRSVEDEEDEEEYGINPVRLAITDVAALGALHEVLVANTILREVNLVGDFANIPVAAAYDYPPQTSFIPAPPTTRRDALTMAQKTAFLSGVQNGNSAASAFDSDIVRLIFAFNYYQDTSFERKIYA